MFLCAHYGDSDHHILSNDKLTTEQKFVLGVETHCVLLSSRLMAAIIRFLH